MGACQSQSQTNVAKNFKQTLQKNSLQSIYPLPSAPVIKVKSCKPIKTALNNIDAKVVNALAEWPHSAHGLFTINFKNKTSSGTGIMIGPNIVLTAGHNLYDYNTKTYADLKSLRFSLGADGDLASFGSVGVKKYFVSPNYIKEQKENYGILILKKSIGKITGYFGLACLEPQEIETKHQSNQHGQTGDIVWYQEEKEYYVYGVHTSGAQMVITRAIYENIHKWVHQVCFKKFIRKLNNRRLELQGQKMDIECVHILMKYSFEDLILLNLSDNNIGAEGAKILASNTSWINLSQLSLKKNNIGAEGAKELAKNSSWTNLSQLDLEFNNIGPEGVKELAQNTSWINLSHLKLSDNRFGAEGARGLAQNSSWVNLSQLELVSSLSDEGATELAKNTSWVKLSELHLSHNSLQTESEISNFSPFCFRNEIRFRRVGEGPAKTLAKTKNALAKEKIPLAKP